MPWKPNPNDPAPPYNPDAWPFSRTCQDCGHVQLSNPPKDGNPSIAYGFAKCRKCKGEQLDYGSRKPYTDAQKAESEAFNAWEERQGPEYWGE